MKKIVFLLFVLLSIPALFFIGFLFVMTIMNVNPEPTIPLTTENNEGSFVQTNTPFSMTIFNIGYAGLDQSQDFFLEGGTMSRPRSEGQTWENLQLMGKFLNEQNSDIIFLQEVNIHARRSFHINQREYFSNVLQNYSSTFGMNHQVKWVPVPLAKPIGDVHSGVLTLAKFYTNSSTRYQLPGKEKWPVRIFDLDRCFIENRIPTENGRELILINLHLSAYDKGGLIRKQQLDFLQKYIVEEYEKENYVIVGGDWNHVIPGTDQRLFVTKEKTPSWLQFIPEDFTSHGFTWGSGRTVPTVRSNAFPYQKGINFVSIIDGFLVSPNVEISQIVTNDLGFKHSDHNPVEGSFILKADDKTT
ncbi:endonuclease/exonuclease/phosphatase family protein [Anaerobacillus isosaccharinicus]|uniref:Endonuclease n=1 Tax=Anaerobacillus isosaccharinicus TaxID=1532552 RepID=A0A1S2L5G5_9BACI|nr:endonuclease/exonuclease/phosphatase family protein [Anaerobacillus isosaccharinicus]MBA5586345.1 endonuclease/exonuclease/phosphatase family protein [Anaerobacillus isosaccharinicus]QOY35406.1 endonuclease/exonuclease/phosphatase family protein [Anaerobacillus isosaccharinicus]